MSKHRLHCCLPMILLATAGLTSQAIAASPDSGRETNYVLIETPAGGVPMLVVRYPWTTHKNPSIEVRTYVQGEEESARIQSLHFRHLFMKDDATIAVYKTEAASSSTRTTAEFLLRDIPFTVVGDRNLLGRPAVCVTCQTDVLKPNKEPFREKARWAIYPLLEPWAADDETLFLSPPEPMFAGPAKIRVFFLRDDDVVWSETKQWPGLKKAEAAQATE